MPHYVGHNPTDAHESPHHLPKYTRHWGNATTDGPLTPAWICKIAVFTRISPFFADYQFVKHPAKCSSQVQTTTLGGTLEFKTRLHRNHVSPSPNLEAISLR